MPGPALHQWSSSQIKVGKCDKKKISVISEIARQLDTFEWAMFKVERTIHSHYSNRFSSTHRFSQLEPKQRFEISTHPIGTYLKKKTLTSSYLKCVYLIYRFSTEKKAIFRAPQNELRLEQRLERALLFRSAKAFRITWFKRQSELSERAWENAVQSGPSGPSCSKAD